MALKRRLNYTWRLFLPVVTIIWLLMGALVFYHYKSEEKLRADSVRSQLDFINQRVVAAYEGHIDIDPFINFISDYFTQNALFDEVTVTVYDNISGDAIASIGMTPQETGVVDISDTLVADPTEIRQALHTGYGEAQRKIGNKMFTTTAKTSVDGRITVHSAIPYSPALYDQLKAQPEFWIIISVYAILATAIAFLVARYMSRSVRILKRFADNLEANNGGMTNMPDFPHDELGDISRRIIDLYREKSDAIVRSEREHAVALHAVQERARMKRQITNNLNHELKTPIGVIRGYLDTIQSNPEMDEATLRRFIDRAHQNVERLCSMIEDVSTITRLDEGSSNIPMEDVDLHELVFNIEHDLTASGTLGNMEFVNEIPLSCHVKGNSTLLISMFTNLCRNAVAHSKGTKIGVKLIIESKKFYTFGFWDNGQGVENEHLNRLFERFYRIDAGRSRKVGGTGLGLPIVKSTVEAHNGTISVHNRATGGLEFIFTLPKFIPEDIPAPADTPAAKA